MLVMDIPWHVVGASKLNPGLQAQVAVFPCGTHTWSQPPFPSEQSRNSEIRVERNENKKHDEEQESIPVGCIPAAP